MLNNKKSPNEVDFEIGRRIKSRRNALGLNQQHLAQKIGVSYQQVQKYENGTDRVGAARLLQISQALNMPIEYFYGNINKGASDEDNERALEEHQIRQALEEQGGRELMLLFANMTSTALRAKLVDIARALADSDKLKRG